MGVMRCFLCVSVYSSGVYCVANNYKPDRILKSRPRFLYVLFALQWTIRRNCIEEISSICEWADGTVLQFCEKEGPVRGTFNYNYKHNSFTVLMVLLIPFLLHISERNGRQYDSGSIVGQIP